MHVRLLAVALLAPLTFLGCGAQRIEIPESVARSMDRIQSLPDVKGEIGELRQQVQASTNFTQNSITGIGANLGKLSESVQGFGGDLAHVSLGLKGQIEAKAEIVATIKAQIQATANLQAKIDAQVMAQVGLKNEIEQLSIASKAGRDSIVSQYTKEMRDTMLESYRTNNYTVWVMSGILVTMMAATFTFMLKMMKEDNKNDREELKLLRAPSIKAGFKHD